MYNTDVRSIRVYYRFTTACCTIQERVPFTDYFDLTVMQSYHKTIPMELFMEELAPTVWPTGKRAGTK